ncbi:MAG: Cobalt-dependent inorganic pyrophosphatase [Candidatus Dichloromethanomonas elyunquensis]|nr:MAG: Cobalt-dependent inorganic pyrophosphatase [Candidatus Dichloromethanomonas elyunquensis]
MSKTKHQQILSFIEGLEIGSKVSVRFIAKELDVSEGTAYRAIKEAENKGWVRSIPKVGTLRIEGVKERQIEDLTLQEVAQIVEGIIVCGENRLTECPIKFIIAAMELKDMQRYLEEDSLCIVGNRTDAQLLALENNVPLLITGGLEPSPEVVDLAKTSNSVIIISPYDTFVVTTMINRALFDRLIERELLLVEDIMVRDVKYLQDNATVGDWYTLSHATGHSRFPVINQEENVVGIVSAVDVAGAGQDVLINQVMTKNPFTAGRDDSVTHISRKMVWEGLEITAVVENGRLIGIISLQDVLEALQQIQKQPQFGETVDNLVLSGFRYVQDSENLTIKGEISQFMSNEFGTASCGILVTLMNATGYIALRKKYRVDAITENFSFYQFYPVPVGTEISISAKLLLVTKKHCTIEIAVSNDQGLLLVKGLMMARMGDNK